MTNKAKNALAAMMMGMALAADAAQIQHGDKISTKRSGKVVPFRSEKVLPKGCLWYHFDFEGNIIGLYRVNTGTGFWQCQALNEKSARRKFDNYKQLLNSKR